MKHFLSYHLLFLVDLMIYPSLILKNYVCTASYPLFKLSNLSLNYGIFPEYWKYSYVVPMFKAGDRENIENFRCISIQSLIANVFDKTVPEQMSTVCNRIIVDEHHGFCLGRSTVTNLLCYQHCFTNAIEKGLQLDSRCDPVNHIILLFKLRCLSFGEDILK